MPMSNAIKNALSTIFNIGASEETTKLVKRVETMQDLAQTATKEMSIDPAVGRRVNAEIPSSLLAASGHWATNSDAIVGECVACRAEAEADGQPERVNVIVKGSLAGGTCKGCGKVHCCSEHGGFDDDGVFWCSDCKFTEKIKKAEGTVFSALLGKWMKK